MVASHSQGFEFVPSTKGASEVWSSLITLVYFILFIDCFPTFSVFRSLSKALRLATLPLIKSILVLTLIVYHLQINISSQFFCEV